MRTTCTQSRRKQQIQASLVLILALTGSLNAFVAIGNLRVSLEDPKVSLAYGDTTSDPTFGRAISMSDEEKMWVFPRAPFTSVSNTIAYVDTSVEPSSVFTVDATDGSDTRYTTNILTDPITDEIHDIIAYSTPPQYAYNFAALINTGIYTVGFESSFDGNSDSNLYKIKDLTYIADLQLSFTTPKLLEVQMNGGGALFIYGSGATDGPRMMNIRYGIDDAERADGQVVTSIDPATETRGQVTWSLQVLIGLYDEPLSPFMGNMVLGAAPGSSGDVSTMSLQEIGKYYPATIPDPTPVVSVGATINDMIQSSLFMNKVITAHSGGTDILSIIDHSDGSVFTTVAQPSSSFNHIYHRGLIHPFGTSVFFALAHDDATTPTDSTLLYLDYSQETEVSNLAVQEIAGLTSDAIWGDVILFRAQGYLALVGKGTDDDENLYVKVNVLCHSTCAACEGLLENQCTRCPTGITLVGSGGVGTCPVDEIEVTGDDMVADCGGIQVPLCEECEEGFIGMCQLCQIGAGLGEELTERGTSDNCVRCIDNCKHCELNARGNFF